MPVAFHGAPLFNTPAGVTAALMPRAKFLTLVVVCLFLAAAAAALYERYQRASSERRYPPEGVMASIGDHSLHVVLRGESGPSVVFEAGSDIGGHLSWRYVQNDVAQFAQTLSYDRSGILWSEPSDAPRDCDTIAGELNALLHATGLPAPYYLVGHSTGGLTLRCFVANYSAQVAGVVLVDASHPALLEQAPAKAKALSLPVPRWQMVVAREFGIVRGFIDLSYHRVPADDPVNRQAQAVGMRSMDALYDELEDIEALVARAGEVQSFGTIPLVVISGSDPNRSDGFWEAEALRREMDSIWRELQLDLLTLSEDSWQINADRSGHYVQLEQPEVVVGAIRELVERADTTR